jgi:hypothetical protein
MGIQAAASLAARGCAPVARFGGPPHSLRRSARSGVCRSPGVELLACRPIANVGWVLGVWHRITVGPLDSINALCAGSVAQLVIPGAYQILDLLDRSHHRRLDENARDEY